MAAELTSKIPLDDIDLDDAGAQGAADPQAASADDAAGDAAAASDAGGDGDADDQGGASADDDAGAAADAAGGDAAGADPDDDDGEEAHGNSGEMITKNRFDRVNERRKAAEAEAAQLREILTNLSATHASDGRTDTTTATETAPEARDFDKEFSALQDKYDQGEIEEAEFRKEERKLIREQAKADALKEIEPTLKELQQERQNARIEKIKAELSTEAAKAYERYPFLNVESEDANKDAINAVMAERDSLIQAGIAPAKALRMAVNEVAPQYGEAVTPAAAKTGKPADEVAARRAAARKAAGAAENAQPPQLGGTGNGARTQAAPKLSASVKDHEKWASIPEAERERSLSA